MVGVFFGAFSGARHHKPQKPGPMLDDSNLAGGYTINRLQEEDNLPHA